MNWDTIKGNWKQAQGTVKEQWSRLTDQDLATAPTRNQLITAIQSR